YYQLAACSGGDGSNHPCRCSADRPTSTRQHANTSTLKTHFDPRFHHFTCFLCQQHKVTYACTFWCCSLNFLGSRNFAEPSSPHRDGSSAGREAMAEEVAGIPILFQTKLVFLCDD